MDLGAPGGAPEDTSASAGGKRKKLKSTTVKERRDEFTFHMARDATKFQRVALRTAGGGRRVPLYDTLCEGFEIVKHCKRRLGLSARPARERVSPRGHLHACLLGPLPLSHMSWLHVPV